MGLRCVRWVIRVVSAVGDGASFPEDAPCGGTISEGVMLVVYQLTGRSVVMLLTATNVIQGMETHTPK